MSGVTKKNSLKALFWVITPEDSYSSVGSNVNKLPCTEPEIQKCTFQASVESAFGLMRAGLPAVANRLAVPLATAFRW